MRQYKLAAASTLAATIAFQPLMAGACVNMPKVFVNTTASYSNDYSFQVEPSGGFKMTFRDQMEEKRLEFLTVEHEMARWDKKNEDLPQKEFKKMREAYLKALEPQVADRRKKAEAELSAMPKPMIVFVGDKLCLTSSVSYRKDPKKPLCMSDKLKEEQTMPIPKADDPRFFVRKGHGGSLMILGVVDGQPDFRNSTVVFPGAQNKQGRGAIVRTYTDGRLDGESEFEAIALSRSLGGRASLPLNGKSYQLTGSSTCGGSLAETNYMEAKGGKGTKEESPETAAVGEKDQEHDAG